MTHFKPLEDRILVRPVKKQEKTAGGLYIPENAQEKSQTGIVIATADDYRAQKLQIIETGQTVLYGKFSGTEIELNGERVLILREKEVMGVVIEEVTDAKTDD